MVFFEGGKDFSAFSALTQLKLLLAKMIFSVFGVLWGIILRDWKVGVDSIRYLEH